MKKKIKRKGKDVTAHRFGGEGLLQIRERAEISGRVQSGYDQT